MADEEEFYRDEHPHEGEPGSGGPGTSGDGGGWDFSWGSGGGGGSGGTSGDSWSWNWGWGGETEMPPQEKPEAEWGKEEVLPDAPVLKTSKSGYLLSDHAGILFSGNLQCHFDPPLVIRIADGDEAAKHLDCVLAKLSDPFRTFTLEVPREEDRREQDKGANVLYGSFSWARPGKFKLLMRWQGGHYDYSILHDMKIEVYGISIGWVTVPLSAWREIASVEITEKYLVYVNHLKGRLS